MIEILNKGPPDFVYFIKIITKENIYEFYRTGLF